MALTESRKKELSKLVYNIAYRGRHGTAKRQAITKHYFYRAISKNRDELNVRSSTFWPNSARGNIKRCNGCNRILRKFFGILREESLAYNVGMYIPGILLLKVKEYILKNGIIRPFTLARRKYLDNPVATPFEPKILYRLESKSLIDCEYPVDIMFNPRFLTKYASEIYDKKLPEGTFSNILDMHKPLD